MKSWLLSWGQILVDALRLLGRHWPQLLVLCLLGVSGRYGFVWLAVAGSALHPTLGVLILPLAPLSNLLALVLMLRMVAESLPAFQATWLGETPSQQWRHHLRVAAGVLLPFIALYAALGMLKQDSRMYIQGITLEEFGVSLTADSNRYEYASGWVLVALVLLALGLRKFISAKELAKRSTVIAVLATYVEALWLMTLAVVFASEIEQLTSWITDRAVVAAALEGWDALLGPVDSWWRTLVQWFQTASAGFGAFVVLPVTWLAITAAAYQTSFRVRSELPNSGRKQDLGLIGWLRRLLRELLDPVVSPVKKLVTAFLRIAEVGSGPLLMLCLSFLVLTQLQVALAWGLRWVVGPRPALLYPNLVSYLNAVTYVFFFVVLMALLPATLNHLSGHRVPRRRIRD